MPKQLLVFGEKTFKITVPDDAKITFGPWSPPSAGKEAYHSPEGKRGTLRIYKGTEKNVLAVFSGVTGFRDLTLEYSEEVAKEEGATIWKSDQNGYEREEKRSLRKEWVEPEPVIKGLVEGTPYEEAPSLGTNF